MEATLRLVQAYLAEVLGSPPGIARLWAGSGLPFFVLDSLDLWELPILGERVVLAIDKRPGSLSPAEIANRVKKVRAKAGLTLYAAPTMTFDERRRLIEHKVPFVVPGNQLYLPDLGIDLREHFRRRAEEAETSRMSPATQAVLIRHLLRRFYPEDDTPSDWRVSPTVRELGYTGMTGSRAVNELVELGLATVVRQGRSIYLRFPQGEGSQVWQDAKPFMRSPVLRTRWVREVPKDLEPHLRVAGEALLAKLTLLAEPDRAVYAVTREQWDAEEARHIVTRPEPGDTEVQIWSYSPSLMNNSADVDPLSLIVSMQDATDERVRMAVKDLEDKLLW